MSVIAVTNETYEQEVLRSDAPVIVDFWASWCGPCRMLAPILDQVASERPDVKIAKINVDEQMELASRFGIVSIPTLIVFKNGQPVNKSMGVKPKADILAML